VTVSANITNKPNDELTMKKLILAMTMGALTVGAYAGDVAPTKDKAACPAKEKACCATKAKAACPANTAKCPAQGQSAKNKPAQSPKAVSNKS